ncbi:MAG: alpha-galactosidase [Candidatus Dormibacteraeota bacterium]|nr:alpha-galactosidase [Candidatus Dormibacteraeota bacterium]
MRVPKIAYIGAGSSNFAARLITDLVATPGLEAGTFALVDIDPDRLELSRQITEKVIGVSGRDWKVTASTDREEALSGCDYVINSIEVAGLDSVAPDYEIPLKYGVDQCIGDTIGPGGIFKALRTGPTWLEIVADVKRLAPDALVMNYTNPMSILTLAAIRATGLSVVGLCHSVQATSRLLAGFLQVPYEELSWRCAGINHNAWFTSLEREGQDLYPRLRELARVPDIYEQDPVRFEVMLHLGAFVTESSGHFSEYVPYFRKRPELLQKYMRPGYLGESGFYAHNWPTWRAMNAEVVRSLLAGGAELELHRSHEYASYIVEAAELDRPVVIHGNVLNCGAISNLPEGCVEVPCRVDRSGLHPETAGPLPEQLAALNRAHMSVHELVVQSLLERDREKARLALMLDPLTAAVCSLEEISRMFDEMWEAERAHLTAFD